MIMDEREQYLGDGLYVSYDGFQLCLRAPREGGDHIVYLEPSAYRALIDYVEAIKREGEKSGPA